MAVRITKIIELRSEGGERMLEELRRIGITGDRAFANVGQSAAQASRQIAAAERSVVGFGRVSSYAFQNVAFQIQDIVTQLALGFPVLQVFAVQGAQIAGAFGPVATALGAVAATAALVGTALLDVSRRSDETRDNIRRLSDAFDSQIKRMRESAKTAEELRAAYRRMSKEAQLLTRVSLLQDELKLAQQRAEALSRLTETTEELSADRARRLERLRAQIDALSFNIKYGIGSDPRYVEERKNLLESLRREAESLRTELEGIFDPLKRAAESRDLALVADILEQIVRLSPDETLRKTAAELLASSKAALVAQTELARVRAELAAISGEASGALPERTIVPEITGAEKEVFIPQPPIPRDEARRIARGEQIEAAYEVINDLLERRVQLQERLWRLEGMGDHVIERLRLERELRERGIDLASEEARKAFQELEINEKINEAIRRREELLKKQKEAQRELERTARQVADVLASGFERATFAGEDLRDVVRGLAEDLARLAFRQIVAEPFTAALTGIIKGFLPGPVPAGSLRATAARPIGGPTQVFGADGLVVMKPKMLADGGVVHSLRYPVGIGEAGPEAVLPLKPVRGKLGVRAEVPPQKLVIEVQGETPPGVRIEGPRQVGADVHRLKLLLRPIVHEIMAEGGLRQASRAARAR